MTTDASVGPAPTEKGVANPLAVSKKKVDLSKFIIEDGEPIDSFFAEKQYRLLTEPLWSSWSGAGYGRAFVAAANVGIFGAELQTQAICPDAMLSINVRLGAGLLRQENRSYFVSERGKVPDVVIEIVSDHRGGEGDRKSEEYARIGVPYYVVFDPQNRLKHGLLRSFVLHNGSYELLAENNYPETGLGLVLRREVIEESEELWIRWCDLEGRLIPNGEEWAKDAKQAKQQAQQADQRAEQADQRAQQADQRAQQADQRAQQAELENQRMKEKLRALGIDLDK